MFVNDKKEIVESLFSRRSSCRFCEASHEASMKAEKD